MTPDRVVHARRSLVAPVPLGVRGRDLHGLAAPSRPARLPSGQSRLLGRRTSWLWSVDELVGGEEAPAHPYLARQMSDVGFWKTLKVRTPGCARSLSLLPIYALARKDLTDELDELAT